MDSSAPSKSKPQISVESFDEAASQLGGTIPPRFCSVKGCKTVLPGSLCYKMCEPCRDRYRSYKKHKKGKRDNNMDAPGLELQHVQGDRAELSVCVLIFSEKHSRVYSLFLSNSQSGLSVFHIRADPMSFACLQVRTHLEFVRYHIVARFLTQAAGICAASFIVRRIDITAS